MPEIKRDNFIYPIIKPRFPEYSEVPAMYASLSPCRGSISGRVMNDGNPVEGAIVVLMNRAGYSDFFSAAHRVVSGVNGEYKFKNIPEWLKYSVIAEFVNGTKNSVIEDYISPEVVN